MMRFFKPSACGSASRLSEKMIPSETPPPTSSRSAACSTPAQAWSCRFPSSKRSSARPAPSASWPSACAVAERLRSPSGRPGLPDPRRRGAGARPASGKGRFAGRGDCARAGGAAARPVSHGGTQPVRCLAVGRRLPPHAEYLLLLRLLLRGAVFHSPPKVRGLFPEHSPPSGLTVRVAGDCDGCGVCIEVCMARAIRLDGGRAAIDPADCKGCGRCAEVCPRKAIVMEMDGTGHPGNELLKRYYARTVVT